MNLHNKIMIEILARNLTGDGVLTELELNKKTFTQFTKDRYPLETTIVRLEKLLDLKPYELYDYELGGLNDENYYL